MLKNKHGRMKSQVINYYKDVKKCTYYCYHFLLYYLERYVGIRQSKSKITFKMIPWGARARGCVNSVLWKKIQSYRTLRGCLRGKKSWPLILYMTKKWNFPVLMLLSNCQFRDTLHLSIKIFSLTSSMFQISTAF